MKKYTFQKVNYKDLRLIISNMYNLYKSGISILNSFELIDELPLSKEYKSSIPRIKEKLESGESLYSAFKSFENLYPNFFLSMLRIGEETGRLGDILYGLDIYYKKVGLIKSKICSLLMYPALLMSSTIFLAIFLVTVILPIFNDVFIAMDKETTAAINFIMNISEFIKNYPISALIFFVSWLIVIPIIIVIYNRDSLKILVNKISIFKSFKEYISIVLISIIIKSGVSISRGLQYCIDGELIGDLRERFEVINLAVIEGKTLTFAMERSNIFTKYTLTHIRVGEECGNLQEVLKNLEDELFDKLIFEINRGLELISPIMIMIIGGIILSFILIFILPIFDGLIG